MSGFAPAHRLARRCYGMTGRDGRKVNLPQLPSSRIPAARRSAKGHGIMLKYRYALVFTALLAAAGHPVTAEGKVPLADETHINQQLIAGAAGDILRKVCPSLSARYFVVWTKLKALEAYARAQGYTEDEVTLFLKDSVQRARVKAAAGDYLAAAGVVDGDVESHCRAGRDEIARETLVGSLLRSSE